METLGLIWLLLPAGVANMIPPLAAKIWPKWNSPIDGSRKWNGKRIFGDHKTIRGLMSGVVVAEIVFLIQKIVKVEFGVIDYDLMPIFLGFVMGFGGLSGDAIKSFFKRQMGLRPGKSWFPWDQIDWILGLVIAIAPWELIGLREIIMLIVIGLVLHLVVKALGWMLKLNESII